MSISNYLYIYKKLITVMIDEQSSMSDDDSNFDLKKLSKPVYGDYLDSNSMEHQSEPQNMPNIKKKRKSYSKRISSILDNGDDCDQLSKTKNIKKNCLSAKKSRLRKKIYIEVLEQKSQTLRAEILKKKERIAENRNGIIQLLRQNNPEKCRYIEEKLAQSKILAKEFHTIKNQQRAKVKEEVDGHIVPPKDENLRPYLKYMLDSFIYKFGFNGVLKRDVIEELKLRWYELAMDENILLNGYENQLKSVLERFKSCMDELEAKSRGMDYLMRGLQEKLAQKDVMAILLKPQFREEPKENSANTAKIDEEEDME